MWRFNRNWLYNAVISSIIEGSTEWTLENGYRNIIANMGIGLDGAVRNIIGQDAEQLIKTRIRDWLDSRGLIIQRNAEQTTVSATGRLLHALWLGTGR